MKTTVSFILRSFVGLLVSHCVAVMLLGQAPRPAIHATTYSSQNGGNDLSVIAGKSVVLDCALPVERVAVGLGGVVEATAISPVEILVNGKAPGETSLILWERGGNREFFNITVRPGQAATNDRLESVRRELDRELPGQPLQVHAENGAVFLSGTVKDLNSSERAVQIASVAGKVVNLLKVEVPKADPQILLKIVFASVDRNKSNQLGINFFSTGFGNVLGAISTGQFSPPSIVSSGSSSSSSSGSGNSFNELNIFGYLPGLNVGATLQALETKGVVQILSEPNVLAENGKQGSILAGGEYPYPVVQASGTGGAPTVTIQFKEYGVRLNFIPTLTPRGSIHLQVAPEVSSLDFTNAVEISGFEVPAIDVRRVKTEIELSKGQSFAIGGLLDNRTTETFQKIPFIGDIPILGKFFQSISKNKTNTELIVIVTPEIVDPIPAGAPLPQLKYPEPFMPENSGIPMHTPESATAGADATHPPDVIPVEKLIDSMKPETPLVIDSSYGTSSGSYSPSGGGSSAPSTPAPTSAPAPQ